MSGHSKWATIVHKKDARLTAEAASDAAEHLEREEAPSLAAGEAEERGLTEEPGPGGVRSGGPSTT